MKNKGRYLFILFVLSVFVYLQYTGEERSYRRILPKIHCSGRIVKKFLDTNGRYQPTFLLDNSETCICYNKYIYKIADSGDIVIKNMGEFIYVLQKKDSVIKFYAQTRDEKNFKG